MLSMFGTWVAVCTPNAIAIFINCSIALTLSGDVLNECNQSNRI
jgi:hypothetical protein